MKSDSRFIKSVFKRYAGLSMLALLCSTLGQLGNSIAVGNILGDAALSVLALVSPLYCIFTIGGYLLGVGGSAVCSFLIGQGEFEKSRKAYTVTYILNLLIAAVLTAVMFAFLPSLLRLLGVTDELYAQVYDYALLTVVCGVFTMSMYLAFNFLRLDGKPTASMIIFLAQAIITIVLDIVLLNNGMGFMGAGIATLAGTAVAGISGFVWLLLKGGSLKLARIDLRDFKELSGKIFKTGSPGAMENSCIACRSVIMNNMLIASFGTFAVTALSVLNSVNALALVIIAAFSGTIVPFIGVFSAERDTASIKRVLQLAVKSGGVLTAVFSLFIALFPSVVAALFGVTEGESYAVCIVAIRIFAISLLLNLMNNILTSLHLSNGKVWLANLITFLRHLGFPVLFFLLLISADNIYAVWNAFWMTEVCTFAVVVLCHLIASVKKPYVSKWTLLNEEMEKRGRSVSATVENSPDAVVACSQNITEFCEENELTPKRTMLVSLSLEEMLNSIREHALVKHANLTMDVRIALMDDIVVIRIRNGGEEFNPIGYYEKLAKNADKHDIDAMMALQDSLGIKMIMDATEVVDYRRTFGVNNLTVIL